MMICSNCNKEIPEGATYCMECGAPIDEPVVLTKLKPKNAEEAAEAGVIKEKKTLKDMKDYEGPVFDFSGYVKSLGNDMSALLGLIGAILVYMAPFNTWIWYKLHHVKATANLFELGGKHGEFALFSTGIIVCAIFIILSSIDMIAFSACKYIGPLKMFEKNYIVRLLPIVVATIFLLLIINGDKYQMAVDSIASQVETAKAIGAASNYNGGTGAGMVILIVGMVIYGVSVLLDAVKGKK